MSRVRVLHRPLMAEINQFQPSTKERPKSERPADVVDIETGRKKKLMKESADTSSVLADALDLIREGHLSDAEIDDLKSISENEKTLLKLISGLFEGLRNKDDSMEELWDLIRQLKKRLGEE